MLSCVKCCGAAFKNILGKRPNRRVIEGADAVRDGPTMLAITLKGDNQFCVPENRHISIVGTRDDLSDAFEFSQISYDAIVNESIIKVVFWLIDD